MKLKFFFLVFALFIGASLYIGISNMSLDGLPRQFTLAFAGEELQVEVADTAITRANGLSGRDSLPEGEGLLFVFPEEGDYGFWMKDMNFSIDILWFDEERRLVDVTEDVYPDTFPETFYPNAPVKYVLETNVGEFESPEKFLGEIFELSTRKTDA